MVGASGKEWRGGEKVAGGYLPPSCELLGLWGRGELARRILEGKTDFQNIISCRLDRSNWLSHGRKGWLNKIDAFGLPA